MFKIERVIVLLLTNRGVSTPRTGGRRAFPTTGFPYTVIYREVATGIRVLVGQTRGSGGVDIAALVGDGSQEIWVAHCALHHQIDRAPQ